MADRQKIVKAILGDWINQNYDPIMPYLDEHVVYTVGAGAAKAICHTPGVFNGKAKVQLWYDSHTLIASMYGKGGLHILCGMVKPPQVVTYEDAAEATVVAVGQVVSPGGGELPCLWTSIWKFNNRDLVTNMQLIADSVAGLARFEAERQAAFLAVQGAEYRKAISRAKKK